MSVRACCRSSIESGEPQFLGRVRLEGELPTMRVVPAGDLRLAMPKNLLAQCTNVPPGGRHWYVIREVGHPDEDTFIDTLEKLWADDELASAEASGVRTVVSADPGCIMHIEGRAARTGAEVKGVASFHGIFTPAFVRSEASFTCAATAP